MSEASARISPTAHYTGYVWYRHGLSHPALMTRTGAAYYQALRPLNAVYGLVRGGLTLESLLLSRHAAIDSQLTAAIDSGRVGQIVEIAAGLSPRGLRYVERHPGLVYLEGDLAEMSSLKRAALDRADLLGPRHHVLHIDALRDDGPTSLFEAAAAHLDPSVGTAVVTEGLINYFDRATIEGLWARIARFLAAYPSGMYLSDIHLRAETFAFPAARAFTRALQAFARGRIHLHYRDAAECLQALHTAGFSSPAVEPPAAFGAAPASPRTRDDIVRVISAVL